MSLPLPRRLLLLALPLVQQQLLLTSPAAALDNNAALAPPLGYNPWNGFKMNFNASLIEETVAAMSENGLLAAGWNYMTLGGSTYPHAAIAPWNRTEPQKLPNVIVRNSTGHIQIDPARFPGPGSSAACLDGATLDSCLKKSASTPESCGCKDGNEGMRQLIDKARKAGFKWGSYSNMAGCQVAACDTPANNSSKQNAFLEQDKEVYLDEWESDYLMVDSVGVTPIGDRHAWQRKIMSGWASILKGYARPGKKKNELFVPLLISLKQYSLYQDRLGTN